MRTSRECRPLPSVTAAPPVCAIPRLSKARIAAARLGMEFMQKPYRHAELARRVRMELDRRAAQRERRPDM
jgi:DNA-binding response OmpR family regulator